MTPATVRVSRPGRRAGTVALVVLLVVAVLGSLVVLATRIGPRIPLTVGPVLTAVGTLMLLGVGPDGSYWTTVLPGVVVFGIGLTVLVAPLTATVLAAAPDRHAGVASGVNNAVARTGSLLAVAALPAAVERARRAGMVKSR